MKLITSLFTVFAAATCMHPTLVLAQAENSPVHHNGALGFHNLAAPLGGRWWLRAQKVALDVGIGFQSTPAPSYDEKLTGWALDLGVPMVLRNWDRVHVLFRPGLLYESQEVEMTSPPEDFDTDNRTSFSLTAELEAEIFIVDNFSVSASHGIGFFSLDPAGSSESLTSVQTLGNNFTEIGFHVYFWD